MHRTNLLSIALIGALAATASAQDSQPAKAAADAKKRGKQEFPSGPIAKAGIEIATRAVEPGEIRLVKSSFSSVARLNVTGMPQGGPQTLDVGFP